MYGFEVTWRGQRNMSRTFQKNINRVTRATLGVLPSTPVAFLQAEGGSVPAEARLNGRQEAFAIRLASREEPSDGLLRAGVGLGSRLRKMIDGARGGGDEVEQVRCDTCLVFPGRIVIPADCHGEKERSEAVRTAMAEAGAREEDVCTIWTDGSRLDDERVGVGVAWFEGLAGDMSERIAIKRRDYRTAGQR